MWCATSSSRNGLISSFCSSVQVFAVSLTSVPESPQTTLRLANASGVTPRMRDFHSLGVLSIERTFIFAIQPGLCSRISIPIQNAFEYSHLLVSGAHRGGDHASAPETCASACLLWRFESHARNRLHNLGLKVRLNLRREAKLLFPP